MTCTSGTLRAYKFLNKKRNYQRGSTPGLYILTRWLTASSTGKDLKVQSLIFLTVSSSRALLDTEAPSGSGIDGNLCVGCYHIHKHPGTPRKESSGDLAST